MTAMAEELDCRVLSTGILHITSPATICSLAALGGRVFPGDTFRVVFILQTDNLAYDSLIV